MLGLSLTTLSLVWAGAFVGAVAAGGAGFAFALTASAIWLHALDPLQVTTLVVACGSILHMTLVWPIRGSISRQRLTPFILGAAVGIPIGVWILASVDPGPLKVALGVGLTIYGIYALAAPKLLTVARGGSAADSAVGFAGGILGGLGGYSGVLPTIWTQLRGWPKQTARGVYQPFILFAHLMTLVLVGPMAVSDDGMTLLLLALPALAAGAWLGLRIYGRLDERRFKQMLSLLLLASGLSLLF